MHDSVKEGIEREIEREREREREGERKKKKNRLAACLLAVYTLLMRPCTCEMLRAQRCSPSTKLRVPGCPERPPRKHGLNPLS